MVQEYITYRVGVKAALCMSFKSQFIGFLKEVGFMGCNTKLVEVLLFEKRFDPIVSENYYASTNEDIQRTTKIFYKFCWVFLQKRMKSAKASYKK